MSGKVFNEIYARSEMFWKQLDKPGEVPVRVFAPLNPVQLSQLQLIRDLSQELQKKKFEEDKKAAEAKEEAIQEEEKKTE